MQCVVSVKIILNYEESTFQYFVPLTSFLGAHTWSNQYRNVHN